MTDQIAYQEYIQRRYNAFCKTVIRCAALDKILKLKRQWERQVSLDYLMNEKFVQFAASEPDEEYPFTVCGQTVLLCNAALADAISVLPEQTREEILRYYFLRQPQRVIGACIGRSRSTAGRHIQLALQRLREEMVAEEFIKIVKNYFDNEIKRPEILGRIGYSNIVPFNFINNKEFAIKIAKSKLRPVQRAIAEKYRIDLEFEDELKFINYILGGADSSKGGRDILNAINDKLLDELAMFMFENKQDLSSFKGAKILVRTTKDGLDFSFEND